MKKIEDYLHLYLQCEAICEKSNYYMVHNWLIHNGDKINVTGRLVDYFVGHHTTAIIKPILRPLSSMTEQEAREGELWGEWHDAILANEGYNAFTPDQFSYLLSKHFDLFGLIDAGLAINATTHKHGQ